MTDPDTSDRHRMEDGISATVLADGAELCSLQDAGGKEMMWQAEPVWPRHSPVLFPIVGRLRDDRLLHDGQAYRLTQHGFARDRRFTWAERDATSCRLVLQDDAATQAMYPFPFRFEMSYRIAEGGLTVGYEVTNTGPGVLPVSVGAHPAFRWPLSGSKTDYQIEFDTVEDAPVRRLDGGLLRADPQPSPVHGRVLPLDPALFEDDAVVMLHPSSRSLSFIGPGGGVEVAWTGFEQLGLWCRAGSDFLCIEPWHGYASPADFDGEFTAKPGLMLIPRGESRSLQWIVRPL